ncbi:uncharacterized protein V1510DRAFT_368593 [Dipodascopsis tothii]|uniref:uncharacterized protein n=1 Tax=Dipodascopsis tothii TaxID=44089 RepID=UPI0034CE431F
MDVGRGVSETISFIAREVLVYAIPPLRSAQGYRAAEWNVDRPLWQGRLRVVERSDDRTVACELRLEDAVTGELFAVAPYDPSGRGVDQVLDSTRFFVVRVVDGERRAYLGMGFAERSEAFDFNIALQDFRRHAAPGAAAGDGGAGGAAAAPEPLKDYSLAEGQTISISIGGRKRPTAPAAAAGGAIPLLAPPPSAAEMRDRQRPAAVAPAVAHTFDDDDDFGDFVS